MIAAVLNITYLQFSEICVSDILSRETYYLNLSTILLFYQFIE